MTVLPFTSKPWNECLRSTVQIRFEFVNSTLKYRLQFVTKLLTFHLVATHPYIQFIGEISVEHLEVRNL